jgi:PAS domain S-box-containing protein
MNPYSVPSLICFMLMPHLGAFIYFRNRQSPVHRLFFVVTTVIAYWAFTEFNLRQAESFAGAFFWTRAGCFKIMLSPLLIHFLLVYIDKWKEYDKFKAISLTYFPAAAIALFDLSTGAIGGTPVKEAWGFAAGKPAIPAVFIFYFSWKIIALSFVLKESAAYVKDADPQERKPFRLFLVGILTAVILGISSAWISGSLRPNFPEITMAVAILFSLYVSYLIWKYNLFLAPHEVADDIIDLMNDGFILVGNHYRIMRVNKGLYRLSGYDEKELIGQNVSKLIETDGEENGNTAPAALRETRLISKTGRFIPVLLSRTTVRNKAGILLATVMIAKDLTQWHKSRQELSRIEKLESLDLIVRSMVHDFNNLLSSISGHLTIADTSGCLPDSLKKNIASAEKAVDVAANLATRLSMYAKANKTELSSCNVGKIIEESADLALKGSSVSFEFPANGDLWPVRVDKYQIVQVFINLFINARQAMSDGGRIKVFCNNVVDDAGEEFVSISVRDEGGGIPAHVSKKIFEPFFTTKPNGSGLGLSIAKSIVEAHHGKISVESGEKIGTTFTILLPRVMVSLLSSIIVLFAKTPTPPTLTESFMEPDSPSADIKGWSFEHASNNRNEYIAVKMTRFILSSLL